METKFTYYLGLDMGTDSLGWALASGWKTGAHAARKTAL